MENSDQPLSRSIREERRQIIAAFRRIGLPADIVESLRQKLDPPEVKQSCLPHRSFRPPAFRRPEQTPEEWKALADAKWAQFRDDLMGQWRAWERAISIDETGRPTDVPLGLDPSYELQPAKTRRGPGRGNRNSTLEERYEWAALALFGRPWKEIAGQYRQTKAADLFASTVQKAATEILRAAKLESFWEELKKRGRA